MTAVPEPSFVKRMGTRPPAAGRPHPSQPKTPHTETSPVEVVAPDEHRAAVLVEYAAPLFAADIVSGSASTVRLQPPAGAAWVSELLALIERWLEATALPCATVVYGGRRYLIASTTAAPFAEDAGITSVPAA